MKVRIKTDRFCQCFSTNEKLKPKGHKVLAGETVSASPASNLPYREGLLWVDSPDSACEYGILLEPDDYEVIGGAIGYAVGD